MATSIATPTPERLDAVLSLGADVYDDDFSDQPDGYVWVEESVPAALTVVPRRSLRDYMQGVDLILEAIEQLDSETITEDRRSELSEDLISALAGTKQKVDDTNAVISMFEALEAAAAKEIERLQARTARFERQRTRLTDYVVATMTASKLKTLDGNTSGLSLRANPAKVEILDMAAIPKEYFRHKPPPPPEADKTSIARDLKKQREVPGARLSPTSFRLVRS